MEKTEPQPSGEKYRRLQGRLAQAVDRSDLGQEYPQMSQALGMPIQTQLEQADRLERVVNLLSTQRLLIPTAVEGQSAGTLITQQADGGGAVVAFSSLEHLLRWDPAARPTAISGTKLCMTALGAAADRAEVILNPDEQKIVVPRAALTAVACGDTWLPPWRDLQLQGQLQQILDEQGGGAATVALSPRFVEQTSQPKLAVTVTLKRDYHQSATREQIGALLSRLAASSRLQANADMVELIPRLCE